MVSPSVSPANQHITHLTSAPMQTMPTVQIAQGIVTDIGISRVILLAELGRGPRSEYLDMLVIILFQEPFIDQDRVFS
jgi:hypothetical protein